MLSPKILVVFAAAILPGSAQRLSFGLKAGGWVTEALDPYASTYGSSEAQRYTFGPALDVRATPWLGIEFDVLYKRAGYRTGNCRFTYCEFTQARGNVFEFPLLTKFHLGKSEWKPFAAAGLSLRHIGKQSLATLSWRSGPFYLGEQVDYTVRRHTYTGPSDTSVGVAASGGLEHRGARLRISIEGRYTRWASRYWEKYGSQGYFIGGNRNQAEALFGIGF